MNGVRRRAADPSHHLRGRRVPVALALAGAALLSIRPALAVDREAVVKAAREIALRARYATFITIGADGQPQARIVDPLGPDADFAVWIGTNPATRKVADLAKDPRATLSFFDAAGPAYVTLVGSAAVVADTEVKAVHFKEEWGPFYKDRFRGADFVLLRFVPTRLEVVSQAHGLVNDPRTWRPVSIEFPAKPAP